MVGSADWKRFETASYQSSAETMRDVTKLYAVSKAKNYIPSQSKEMYSD